MVLHTWISGHKYVPELVLIITEISSHTYIRTCTYLNNFIKELRELLFQVHPDLLQFGLHHYYYHLEGKG